jgi:uncharacterized protein DUF4386
VPVTRAESAFRRVLNWFSLPMISRLPLPTVSIASTEHDEKPSRDPMEPVIEARTVPAIPTTDGSRRATARLVGGLFILATAAGVASVVLQQAVTGAPDYLAEAHRHEGRLATAALLEIVMSVAVAAIAVALYPVLARFRARLAIGYVVARAAEGTIYLIGTAGLLTLLTLSGSTAVGLSDFVLAARDVTATVIGTAAFSVSAVILNYVLFRARLVPGWLSGWGLVAATSYVAGGVLGVYGPDPDSVLQTVLDLPLAIQEMTLAGWLIIRGFRRVDDGQRR